jgi:hypothetical protein
MDSSLTLTVFAVGIVIGIWNIGFKLDHINRTLKGLPGWKKYHEPETEVQKVDPNNLSVHLPKK